MKKLKQFVENALLAEPEGFRAAVRSVAFDRKTIAHVFIGGVKWFLVMKALDERGLSEVEYKLLDRMTPPMWAEFIHERLARMQ